MNSRDRNTLTKLHAEIKEKRNKAMYEWDQTRAVSLYKAIAKYDFQLVALAAVLEEKPAEDDHFASGCGGCCG